jgi:hypothetical protein
MRYPHLLLLLACVFHSWNTHAQYLNKKQITIPRLANANIKIDGIPNEKEWKNAATADNFITYSPNNGDLSACQTEVKIFIDDHYLYFAAKMYDPEPDKIKKGLCERDGNIGNNAEQIAFQINPYNDGVNVYIFRLSAANIQRDVKVSNNGTNDAWNTIWHSQTSITKKGWIAEVKIPLSLMKVPNEKEQNWGMNIYRTVFRTNELSSWSYVDSESNGHNLQAGTFKIPDFPQVKKNISLWPYMSAYYENNKLSGSGKYIMRGGMDIRYSLNQSYSLDMMLIPDFGQVQGDDKQLNLSAYEIQYEEKRQFFNEGKEMFDKAGIFYSRRIGSKPANYLQCKKELRESEKIVKNPEQTPLLNVSKISGRNAKGLGIGLLNAVSNNAYATFLDTLSGTERDVLTQPITNYNVLVIDQNLKNNSSVSIINTNLYRNNYVKKEQASYSNYMANNLATEANLINKTGMYKLQTIGAMSSKNKINDTLTGFHYLIDVSKIMGKFRFVVSRTYYDNVYNPNDMGYLSRNNMAENSITGSYAQMKPFWIMNSSINSLTIKNTRMVTPSQHEKTDVKFTSNNIFSNFTNLTWWVNYDIKETRDYIEPRKQGYVLITPQRLAGNISITSNTANPVFIKADLLRAVFINNSRTGWAGSFAPACKLWNRLIIDYEYSFQLQDNMVGFATIANNDVIVGQRDVVTNNHIVNAAVFMNKKHYFNTRARYYKSYVDYNEFFELSPNGAFLPTSETTQNHTLRSLNFDIAYTFRFSPGSEFSVVYKKYYLSGIDEVIKYQSMLNNDIFSNDLLGSISFKLLYYIDSNMIASKKPI